MSAPKFDLADAFLKRQEKLRSDLGLGDLATHPGTKGDDTELNWSRMLGGLLPKRYGVAKSFVIDSRGGLSDQIDLVIHDRHFSPLLFEVGGALYIPAESVYAVFEVRQELDKENLEYAADKVASVRRLLRTSVPVPHAGGTYDPVLPKLIIGGLLGRCSAWNPPFGIPFENCLAGLSDDRAIDIGCLVEHGSFATHRSGSGVESTAADVALIHFVMTLLRRLQVAGTAPAIDYDEYLKAVLAKPGRVPALADGRTA